MAQTGDIHDRVADFNRVQTAFVDGLASTIPQFVEAETITIEMQNAEDKPRRFFSWHSCLANS